VLKISDRKDVLDFLQRDDASSRGRKRSTSKFDKNRSNLKNVHSIQGGVTRLNPPMQFVQRSSTIDGWGKIPNASFMSETPSNSRMQPRSRSKSKPKNFAYISITSSHHPGRSSTSRSKSVSKPRKLRSPSVRSS
jgi:hypothetical protein